MSNNKNGENSDQIDEEVKKLFKNYGIHVQSDLNNLNMKYNTRMTNEIKSKYFERYNLINKRADKLTRLTFDRYGKNTPLHEILKETIRIKNKYHLSNEEFSVFQRKYESLITGNVSTIEPVVDTNMMKVLGPVDIMPRNNLDINIADSDYKHLEKILYFYESTKDKYSRTMIQSLAYTDCDSSAINGVFKKDAGVNIYDHIHPVIVALFIPKIPIVERYFLYTNLAEIIKQRFKHEQIINPANIHLINALVKDNNDVVCNNSTPMLDLLHRVNIQTQLWNCVLNLRNGQYFNTSFNEFMSAINNCKLNQFDNPDLLYGKYDGTVIKRLFSAFSFKPTVVISSNRYQHLNTNPYFRTIAPNAMKIGMLNIVLPNNITNTNIEIDLSESLSHEENFIINGVVVPKEKSVLYSELLVFYIDRRKSNIKYNLGYANNLLNVSNYPMAIAGFEKMNDTPIRFQEDITVNSDNYSLRSVICSETLNSPENVIIGSTALIITKSDPMSGRYSPQYICYDPVNLVQRNNVLNSFTVTPDNDNGTAFDNFYTKASTTGIVFIYENVKPLKQ